MFLASKHYKDCYQQCLRSVSHICKPVYYIEEHKSVEIQILSFSFLTFAFIWAISFLLVEF